MTGTIILGLGVCLYVCLSDLCTLAFRNTRVQCPEHGGLPRTRPLSSNGRLGFREYPPNPCTTEIPPTPNPRIMVPVINLCINNLFVINLQFKIMYVQFLMAGNFKHKINDERLLTNDYKD